MERSRRRARYIAVLCLVWFHLSESKLDELQFKAGKIRYRQKIVRDMITQLR